MPSPATRRRRILAAYASSLGWELPTLTDDVFDGDTMRVSSTLSTSLPHVTSEDQALAIDLVFALEANSDPAWEFTYEWPEGCRSVENLAGLEPTTLERLGVKTLAQRLALRRLGTVAISAEGSPPRSVDTSAATPPTLAETLRMRRLLAAPPPDGQTGNPLSDARWSDAPRVQAARTEALARPQPWPAGGAAVATLGTLYLMVPAVADGPSWMLLGGVSIALFVAKEFRAAQRTGAALLAAGALHYVLTMIGSPGTPAHALVSGAVACAYASASVVWVGFTSPPNVLLQPYTRVHVPTGNDLAKAFQTPMLLDLIERKRLSETEVPELSDKALYDVGLTTIQQREEIRQAMMPTRVQDPLPLWRQYWQTSAAMAFAALTMLVGTAAAALEQSRLHDEELVRQSQIQTEYAMQRAAAAQEAASNARATRAMAAQAQRDAANAKCTYMCQDDWCSGGFFSGNKHYGDIKNEKCAPQGSGWVCTNGPCR